MSFNQYVRDKLGIQEQDVLSLASREADPVTFLNLQFAINEKNRKEGRGVDPRTQSFEEIVESQRQVYFASLRANTEEALRQRKIAFVKETRLHRFERDHAFTEVKRYSSIAAYNSHIDTTVRNSPYIDAKWGENRKAQFRYLWDIYYSKPEAYDSYISQQKIIGGVSRPDFLKPNFFEIVRDTAHGYLPDKVPLGYVLKFCKSYREDFVIHVLEYCFPSIRDYEMNKSAYPHFVDYMESQPFPSSEMFDLAVKKIVGYGTEKYGEEMSEFLDWVSENNLNESAGQHFFIQVPQTNPYIYAGESQYNYPMETHFVRPKINGFYSFAAYENARQSERYVFRDPVFTEIISPFKFSAQTRKYVRRSSFEYFWWPRPKEGFQYVPKVGFVDPRFFMPFYLRPKMTLHKYQELEEIRIRKARERAKRKKKKSGGLFGDFVRGVWEAGTSGDPFKAFGAAIGGTLRMTMPNQIITDFMKNNNITKDIYREINDFSGGFMDQINNVSDLPAKWIRGEPITEADLMAAADIGIKIAVVVASGGTAAAVIGVSASQLQRGSWGEDEVGSLVLQMGEIAALSYAANAGVDDVIQMAADRVIVEQARQTIYNRTDLGDTVYGTLMVEIGVRSGYRVSKGEDFVDALMATADQAVVMAAAKESPEAAMIMGAVIAIRDIGYEALVKNYESLTTPEEWFDNFSWEELGEDIKGAWKNLDSSTRKKIIGISIMMAAGKMKPEQALKMIGQQIAIRQINQFYRNEPVSKPSVAENQRRTEAIRLARKAQAEEKLFQDLRQGKIPTPRQMTEIVDSQTAQWAWDSIMSVVPSGARIEAFELQFDLGLPDWDIELPDLPKIDLSVPDWAKIPKADMPEWSQITLKEEWRVKLEEAFKKKVDGVMDKLTWQNLLYAYLQSLWPPHVPLRRVGDKSGEFKYIDENGKLIIRPALTFPHDHPMLTRRLIKKRYTEDQKAYIEARNKETLAVINRYKELTGESLNYTTLPSGEIVTGGMT